MRTTQPQFTADDDNMDDEPTTKTSSYPKILFHFQKTHFINTENKHNSQVLIDFPTTAQSDPRSNGAVTYIDAGDITPAVPSYDVVMIDDDDGQAAGVPLGVCGSRFRVHRDWHHCSWVPPIDRLQKKSYQMELESNGAQFEVEQERNSRTNPKPGTTAEVRRDDDNLKGKKLRIKYGRKQLDEKFSLGTTVEVKSDEDGYQGSWYTAIIIGSAGVGKFLVEYQSLKTDDETELLREVVNEENIRPCPPLIPQINRYKVLEEVDAWYNDGWWEGVVSEVLDDWKYAVYFASTNEKLVYQHSNLRPHQNWVHGKWFLAPKKSRRERKSNTEETLQQNFPKGTAVEVRSDEEGYQRSWYTATIIGFTAKDKFLVEYLSLKTNGTEQPLREEVSAIDVRPCPPWILHIASYKRLEEVDVWYDGGWWFGVISEVLKNKKYVVDVASKGVVKQEWDHADLRPHQEWVGGKWIIPKKRPSEVKLRAKPSKKKRGRPRKSDGSFRKGAMVEVRSDEPGYEGSWYSATIVQAKRNGRFVVKYLTLKTDDGREFLKEETVARNIRPCPPKIKENDDHYCVLEKIDAWVNEGWWVGVISKVLPGGKYMVYFDTSREEMVFDYQNLRSHQEWINGGWIVAGKQGYSSF